MKRKSIFKIVINLVIVAGILFLISWVLSNNKKNNDEKTALAQQTSDAVAVKLYKVSLQKMDQDFKVNGNFQPFREMDYASENSGRVVSILVKEGSYVRPGQTLAIVNADLLNVDMQSAEANLANALRDQQRFENAYKTGGVTQQQLDQIRLQVENAKARVEQTKIHKQDANVRSSIRGIVNKKYIEPGAYVSPGTKMFELVDISRLKLIVNVTELQVTQLKPGDKVDIVASVFPDKTFPGKISFIGNKADDALNFPVEIEVDNSNNTLKAGMYGTALFAFSNQKQSVVVPRSAFAGSVSSNEVFVVENGVAKIRKVTSGKIIGDQVEILDGLKDGETVVVSGQINLSDGSKVTAVQ